MPLKFDREKLRQQRQTSWLVLDLFMVALVVVNLAFIIFDTLFGTAVVQGFFAAAMPAFHDFYLQRIHVNFLFYDLIFISIFLAEFALQWVVAVRKRSYPRWYFFPFMRWYDLVGCIPVGSLRLLRLLRLVSLVVRLQKMGIIDLTETRIYEFFAFYYNAFVDEVSDRVQLRVLDDVKREFESENPIAREIITEVVAPRREMLVEELSRRIGFIAERSHEKHREEIRDYVESVVADAVTANRDIRTLKKVPLLGHRAVSTLEQAINDIVYGVFERVMADISQAENNRVVDEIINVVFDVIVEDHPELGDAGTRMATDAIELIKERIRVQHWKESLRAQGAAVPKPAS